MIIEFELGYYACMGTTNGELLIYDLKKKELKLRTPYCEKEIIDIQRIEDKVFISSIDSKLYSFRFSLNYEYTL